ncbi:protein BTG4-like isoform X2 [Vanacampus margaritifer]
MKEEIAAAVFFVGRLVKRYGCLDNDSRERFAAALTSALFESYKNHWHPYVPTKGQGHRCLRMNRMQLKDPVLQKACERSGVRYEDLGLPQELTVWVDPGEVACRYGEHSAPFSISVLDGSRRSDGQFSRRVHDAVERAGLDVPSESSSDEEDDNNDAGAAGSTSPSLGAEPKTIPTVNNPNSVYRRVCSRRPPDMAHPAQEEAIQRGCLPAFRPHCSPLTTAAAGLQRFQFLPGHVHLRRASRR